MKDNKKLTSLILVLVLMIVAVISGTFAYWQWITATEQETLVNVSLTDDATIIVDDPTQSLVNMYPTSDCDRNGTSSWTSKITVNNGTGVKMATNFKLKIKIEDKDGNIITTGTNEWNSNDFKYYVKFAVSEVNESCKNALYTGRFDGTTPTDETNLPGWYDSSSITLDGADGFPVVSSRIGSGVSFYALPNVATSHKYKVWIWIDKDYKSVTVGNDSSMDKMQDAKITVSWSENSGLEQIKISEPVGEAIAIYSEDDQSLRFYREENPASVTVGSNYNGRVVTEKYTGFENSNYTTKTQAPWSTIIGQSTSKEKCYYDEEWGESCWDEYFSKVSSIVFEDYIYPVSTAYWFRNLSQASDVFVDVTKLDVYNVTDMSNMFGLKKIEFEGLWPNLRFAGIETWDTSNVTNMSYMFNDTDYLSVSWGGDITKWNVCNVTNYDSFYGSNGELSDGVSFPNFGNEKTCSGDLGHAVAIYSEDDRSLRFYRVDNLSSIKIGSTYNGRVVTEFYTGFENIYNYSIDPWYPSLSNGITTIVFEDYVYPGSDIDLNYQWFYETFNYYVGVIEYMDISKLDTSYMGGDGLAGLFYDVEIQTLVVSNLNLSNVTNMSNMFKKFTGNIIGLETWDTSNVENMNNMFSDYSGSSLDLTGWNVCKVTSYSSFGSSYVTNPFFGNTSKCNGGNPA